MGNALEYGWDGEPSAPDEAEVREQALVIETNLEKKGTELSEEQKDAILEAVRAHEVNERRIDMTRKRLAVMKKLTEEDDRDAKKQRMEAQAEKLYDEQDAMNGEVESAKALAKQALFDQKQASEPDPTEDLVQALQNYNEATKQEQLLEQASDHE